MSFTKTCNTCHTTYNAWHWFGLKNSEQCILCIRFVPMRDERTTVLESCRYYYLWSGETNEEKYNKIFVSYADTWCDHWSISQTSNANTVRQQLLSVKNWTREYWH